MSHDIIAGFTQEDVVFLRGIESEAHREATASKGEESMSFILAADKGMAAESLADRIEAELRGEVATTQGGSPVNNPFPEKSLEWCAYEIAVAKWGKNIARMAAQLEKDGYGWERSDDTTDHLAFTDFCAHLAMFSVKDEVEGERQFAEPLHLVIAMTLTEVDRNRPVAEE